MRLWGHQVSVASRGTLAPGPSPRTGAPGADSLACVSLFLGIWVRESPDLGLLGCSTPRIPFKPLLSFLSCGLDLRALAFPPPPGKPPHPIPPQAALCPSQPEVVLGLFASPPSGCPGGCVALLTAFLTDSGPEVPFQGVFLQCSQVRPRGNGLWNHSLALILGEDSISISPLYLVQSTHSFDQLLFSQVPGPRLGARGTDLLT